VTDLNELLGIDMTDPLNQHAQRLAEAHGQLIYDLVAVRHRKGLSRKEVAERCGWKRSQVSDFERTGGDPWLSSISRYALAVGAELQFTVTDIEEVPGADASAPSA
jgi:transcriptional regulator with XRE-family HTH domain